MQAGTSASLLEQLPIGIAINRRSKATATSLPFIAPLPVCEDLSYRLRDVASRTCAFAALARNGPRIPPRESAWRAAMFYFIDARTPHDRALRSLHRPR